jgi:hypothetical protein
LFDFTTPWNALQRFRQYEAAVRKISIERIAEGPLREMICAENPNSFFPGTDALLIPQVAAPNF